MTGAKDVDAAYAHRDAHPDEYAVPEPSAEVLANVELIRKYEDEQTKQMGDEG